MYISLQVSSLLLLLAAPPATPVQSPGLITVPPLGLGIDWTVSFNQVEIPSGGEPPSHLM